MLVKEECVDKIIDLAKIAFSNNEVPVGAIVVRNDEVIGMGYNTRDSSKSVIGHAEIMAIEKACEFVGDWRLDDCELYVTLAPCMMCSGAIIESRIKKVYYLLNRINVCFCSTDFLNIEKINDNNKQEMYLKLLQLFFENKRNMQ